MGMTMTAIGEFFGATAASGSAASAGASTVAANVGSAIGQAAVGAAVTSALAPDAPEQRQLVAMPDPKAQDAARRRSLAEQLERRGRASTVLTNEAGKLGG